MNENLAYVKKYKVTFNLIISIIISLLLGIITFFAFSLSSEGNTEIILDLIFAFVIFITLIRLALKTFVKQHRFNKITPIFYIQLENNKHFTINKKIIKFEDIVDISYKKIHPSEIFGTPTENDAGLTTTSIFKFQQKFADKMSNKGKQKYNDAVFKSNIGNLVIKTKTETITLKRVQEIEKTVTQLKNMINKK